MNFRFSQNVFLTVHHATQQEVFFIEKTYQPLTITIQFNRRKYVIKQSSTE